MSSKAATGPCDDSSPVSAGFDRLFELD